MARILLGGQVIVEFEGSGAIRHGQAPEGHSIYLNLEGVGSGHHFQTAVVHSELFKGREGLGRSTEEGLRIIQLSRKTGSGSQILPDGRAIVVQVDEGFPIRRQVRGLQEEVLGQNPRWRR